MKSLLLMSLLLFSVTTFATPKQYYFPLILEEREPQPLKRENRAAIVTIDQRKNAIKVELFFDPCGLLRGESDEIRCAGPIILEQRYNLNYTGSQKDTCGSIIYQGALDQSPLDGLTISLILQDNAKRECQSRPPASADLTIANKRANKIELLHLTTPMW